MKTTRLALLLAALAAHTHGGDAKVTLDSSNGSSAFIVRDSASNELARVQSDGKVGIGTTTPASKLQVYGTETGANWAGRGVFGGASNAVVLGQYNNKAYFGAHNGTLDGWSDLTINPGGGNVLLANGGGNVGIGTTTPTYKLHVVGSIDASAISINGEPVATSKDTYWSTAGSGAIQYSGGNVGIGKATPAYPLDVLGDINLTGAIYKNGVAWNPLTSYTETDPVFGASAAKNIAAGDLTAWNAKVGGSGTASYVPKFTAGGTVGDSSIVSDASGKVGIGTASPTRLLSLAGTQSVISLNNTSTESWTGLDITAKNGTYLATLGLEDASGKFFVDMRQDAVIDFTILQNGSVGIGTSTPSQKLDVAGNIKITNQSGPVAAPDKIDLGTSYSNGATRDQCKIYLYDAGGTQKFGFGIGANADIQYHSYQAHDFYVDNSKRFSVTVSGGANTSDRRLKRDILPLNKYGLQQVMQLNPVTYIYKDDSANTPQVGFIAQEVQQIIPEVVTGKEGDLSKGESLGIVYGNLVPVLTKAIQELKAENDTLKAQNADILKRLDALEAK